VKKSWGLYCFVVARDSLEQNANKNKSGANRAFRSLVNARPHSKRIQLVNWQTISWGNPYGNVWLWFLKAFAIGRSELVKPVAVPISITGTANNVVERRSVRVAVAQQRIFYRPSEVDQLGCLHTLSSSFAIAAFLSRV
jgi:hypothetical protein